MRYASGPRRVDVLRLIERRRSIARSGFAEGRWSAAVLAAALLLASRPEVPAGDEAWIGLLDRLEPELGGVIDRMLGRSVQTGDHAIVR
jgi:hypothetical protein